MEVPVSDSPPLAAAWAAFDRFEGRGYERILVPVFGTEQAGERRPHTVANLYAATESRRGDSDASQGLQGLPLFTQPPSTHPPSQKWGSAEFTACLCAQVHDHAGFGDSEGAFGRYPGPVFGAVLQGRTKIQHHLEAYAAPSLDRRRVAPAGGLWPAAPLPPS